MNRVGVEPAGKRFGGFAEAGVDAAEALRVEKDTGAVGLMIDSGTGPVWHEEGATRWDTVSF